MRSYYRGRYPQICWNVHGSGLAGVANVPPEQFAFIGGRCYHEAAKFAVIVAETVARELKCSGEIAFTDLRQRMTIAAGVVYLNNRAVAE